jgi:hypothetical protein
MGRCHRVDASLISYIDSPVSCFVYPVDSFFKAWYTVFRTLITRKFLC